MKVPAIALSFVFTLSISAAFCQDFSVPENYQFDSKDDYSKYEKDIISAAKWLVGTPLDEQQDKRKQISAFVIKWVSGSPTVNTEINPTIMDFEKKNPGMIVIYMASSA